MKRFALVFLTSGGFGGALVAMLLSLSFSTSVVYAQKSELSTYQVQASHPRQDDSQTGMTPDELANIRVYQVASQSVVNITTSTVQYDFFATAHEGQGAGSGSVLDHDGHILTNHHVVEGAREIQVTLASGASHEAKLVGADAEYDIAVLKIDAPAAKLVPITLGSSSDLRVGQKAYAVGNPFGLEGTLTTGIISSLNRSIGSRKGNRTMTAMIQTDAAMNPGNSGGPLLDSRARMIGMNVAIASRTGQNAGVGFAIPVDRIKRFVPELLEHGKVLRAYHGIVTLMETPQGLKIARLSRGGPSEKAGLRGIRILRRERREGPFLYRDTVLDRDYADNILAINHQPVQTHAEFIEIMDRLQPGEVVTFTVLRDGERQEIVVTLGEA